MILFSSYFRITVSIHTHAPQKTQLTIHTQPSLTEAYEGNMNEKVLMGGWEGYLQGKVKKQKKWLCSKEKKRDGLLLGVYWQENINGRKVVLKVGLW